MPWRGAKKKTSGEMPFMGWKSPLRTARLTDHRSVITAKLAIPVEVN